MDWWRFGLWLRKRHRIFAEENLFGAALVGLRAWGQTPICVLREPNARSLHKAGLCLRLSPRYTMVAPPMLFALYDLVEQRMRAGVPGSIVECGVWNGGSAAAMADAARAAGASPEVWLFDSFQGLPEPGQHDPEAVREFFYTGWNRGDELRVRRAFSKLGLPESKLHIRAGWFHETFPENPVEPVAILHVDCDWYDPIRLCLETWWDRLSPGGLVILNDYGLYEGANRAVDEFLAARAPEVELHAMGPVGAWFERPSR